MNNHYELTPEQFNVVHHRAAQLLVSAGPGSGKTQVLATRISTMVEHGIDPATMAIVTFTNEAAREMRSRIQTILGREVQFGHIGTLHSFCLRELHRLTGRRVSLIDQEEAEAILATVAKRMNCRTTVKNLLCVPLVNKPRTTEEIVVSQWHKEMRTLGVATFDNLLEEVADMAESIEWIKYLFVDEFQDSGRADMRIYEGINAVKFFVGDVNQSIYGFRGADVRNFGRVASSPDTDMLALEGNFRCGSNICRAANSLMSHGQKTVSMVGVPGSVTVVQHGMDIDELSWLCQTLSGRDYNNCAVLARTNAIARRAAEVLEVSGIPVATVEQQDDQRELRMAVNLCASRSDYAAKRWITFKKGADEAEKMYRESVLALRSMADTIGLPPCRGVEGLSRALVVLGVERDSIGRLEAVVANLPQPSMEALQADLAAPKLKTIGTGVTVGSIHSAKGREWDTVIIIGCEQETIPGRNDEDEERRLMYVGITRAKRELILSHVTKRQQTFGRKQYADMTPSKFLRDLGCL